MMIFHEVKLELVRPGPPHNQLLSPLTRYMALCGEGSPVTFNMELEHHQLLSRLQRLRYVSPETGGIAAVPNQVREATVIELGEEVKRIFESFSTLLAEVWRTGGDMNRSSDDCRLIHLRLVLSGSELSLIPFEISTAPMAYPGEGLELALQFHMPVVLTREVRRTRPVPVPWNRRVEPRVLFVSAAPEGLTIPLLPHVQALRAAVDPWIRWPDAKRTRGSEAADAGQRPPELVKERLRILPNANINSIYEICSRENFTHVHILAHGDTLQVGGESRFGIALCHPQMPDRKEVVDGKRLAKALQAEGEDGSCRCRPLMVTLATCDSGNPGSVVIPGGSIAHDLHSAGIPWVIASQFPLTKRGSVRITAELYRRLLRGDDPRQVVFEVRRQLFMSAERDHDWASLVVYATVPADFPDQVAEFFERQTGQAINVSLARADDLAGTGSADDKAVLEALDSARACLELWKNRLPEGRGFPERQRRAKYYGIRGSTFKRIGLLHWKRDQESASVTALRESLSAYRIAMEQWVMDDANYHWVATQALSLAAVLKLPREPGDYLLAHHSARRDLTSSSSLTQAWAHGSLAELELLSSYHIPDKVPRDVKRRVKEHCKAIIDLTGQNSFAVHSTLRQFKRYVDPWGRPSWRSLAREACEILEPRAPGQEEFPGYA